MRFPGKTCRTKGYNEKVHDFNLIPFIYPKLMKFNRFFLPEIASFWFGGVEGMDIE